MLFAFQKVITMKNNSLLAVYKALFIKNILRNLVIQLVGNDMLMPVLGDWVSGENVIQIFFLINGNQLYKSLNRAGYLSVHDLPDRFQIGSVEVKVEYNTNNYDMVHSIIMLLVRFWSPFLALLPHHPSSANVQNFISAPHTLQKQEIV